MNRFGHVGSEGLEIGDYRAGLGAVGCTGDSTTPAGNRFKKVVYNYDLISGKVNSVCYQPGQRDAFYHRYGYDAENRLTKVETSRDSLYWERDAAYSYYRHGPLSRTVLGALQVQGEDYAYTVQGWLKGVNGTRVGDGSGDMGRDGAPGVNALVARDAFGYALHYYSASGTGTQRDYRAIGSGTVPFANPVTTTTSATFNALYNGNIAAMSVNLPRVGVPMLYAYRYDQLNRLVAMAPFTLSISTSNVYTAVATQDYAESGIRYDPAGNILAYTRNGSASAGTPLQMDQLTYWYYYTGSGALKQYNPQAGIPADAARLTNQLASVKDAVSKDNYSKLEGTEDVDNMPDSSYAYDAIGNMTQNKGDSVLEVGWNVYGKISYLTKRVLGVNQTIVYAYDASGNRISKSVGGGKTTYYVRDAQGNVLSTYERKQADTLRQTELHLYGSSRLGVLQVSRNMEDCQPDAHPDSISFVRGWKQYELSNHLGNVLATISDRHFGVDSNSNGVADYYLAEVITEQDYYPFGMQMPGRKYPTYQPAPPANGGSPSSPIELYRHSFTTPATGSPYTAAPNTQSAYIDSSKWTSGTGSFTGTLVPGSTTDYALTIPTAPVAQVSPGGYTLTLNVQSGYRLTLTSFSFSRLISSLSGHIKWRLYVNGTQVAVYTATNTTTMTSTGNYTLASPVTGLTGAVSIQLGLTGAAGDTTSFTLDNFVLNGFVQRIPTASNIGQGGSNAERYRYGFNGKEYDNEVYGDGGEQDYGMRIYDARIGRFFSVDPLFRAFAWNSLYAFSENDVIRSVDLDGLEKRIVITQTVNNRTRTTFDGSFQKLQTIDNKFSGPMVDQIVGSNKQKSQFLAIDYTGSKTVVVKDWKSSDLVEVLHYEYTHYYLNEDDDIVTEKGSFDVRITKVGGTKIWDPITYLIINKAVDIALTRVVSGASLLKGITLDAGEAANTRVAKLLRWTKVTGGDFTAAAAETRAFTQKIGQRAVSELKQLGYTREDFVKWKGIYEDIIEKYKKTGKNAEVQTSRLESVNKILTLWKK